MEIQNISGPDAVPQGFAPSAAPTYEVARVQEEQAEVNRPRVEGRGAVIDTYA